MSEEQFEPGDLAVIDGVVARIVHFGSDKTTANVDEDGVTQTYFVPGTQRAEWVTLTAGGGLHRHGDLIHGHVFQRFDERLRPAGRALIEAAALDSAIAAAAARASGPHEGAWQIEEGGDRPVATLRAKEETPA